MSVGFKIRGKINKFKLNDIPIDRVIRKLMFFIQSSKGLVPGYGIEYTHKSVNQISIFLYPAENPIEISLDKRFIYAEAQTNSAGPGYHSYAISFLDSMAKSLGIRWQYTDFSENFYDDSYYSSTGNFIDIQLTMSCWLQKIIALLADRFTTRGGFLGGFSISLPLDIMPATIKSIWHPMGYVSFDELLKNRMEEPFDESITALSINANFFPWWNEERDAAFHINLAKVFMWYYSPWIKTNDKETIIIYNKIIACLEYAYQLDKTLDYPFYEWAETYSFLGENEKMEELLKLSIDNGIPKIGFRRENITFHLCRNWSIRLHGSMIYKRYDESEAFYGVNRQIRLISLDIDNSASSVPLNEIVFANCEKEGYVNLYRLNQKGIEGKILHSIVAENELTLYSTLAKLLSGKNLLFISIYYTNPDDKRWAMRAVSSIIYNDPELDFK